MSRGSRHPLRAEAIAAIQAHMAANGAKDWRPLWERYEAQGVNKPTFWNWIREAKEEAAASPTLAAAKNALQTVVTGREDQLPEGVAAHLPATPSPAFISKAGPAGLKQFDMVLEIHKLYADAEMLRNYAVKKTRDEATGAEVEQIKNPIAFDKSIARRANLLETSIRAVQEIWNLRTMQQFYEVVVQEIGKADPETQRRILQRLAELNQRTGMNMAAEF